MHATNAYTHCPLHTRTHKHTHTHIILYASFVYNILKSIRHTHTHKLAIEAAKNIGYPCNKEHSLHKRNEEKNWWKIGKHFERKIAVFLCCSFCCCDDDDDDEFCCCFFSCMCLIYCMCMYKNAHAHTYAQSIIRGTTKIPNNNEIVLTGAEFVIYIHTYIHTGATVLNRVESSENCEERKSRI